MKNLEKLLSEFRSKPIDQAHEYAEKIINAVSYAMEEDKEFIMPVVIPDEILSRFDTEHLTASQLVDFPENFNFTIHTLSIDTGESVYVAFTNYDEVNKGQPVSTITTKIDHYLEGVLFNPDIVGLVINPFGNSCFLPKEFIEEIFLKDYINSKPTETETTVELVLNESSTVEEAIAYANECHKGDFRKGTDTPYIVHPLEVAQILTSVKADYNLIIAGLLHDVVEDAGVTLETIKEKYGKDVARLVAAHSEDKSKVWYARKLKTIRDLPHEDIRSKLLTLGDKLSNIRSMYNDYKQVGEELWERFNAPKTMQSWYYGGIVDGLIELQSIPACADAYNELNRIYKELFVDFFLDEASNTLYQISAHGEGYYLNKGNPQWLPPQDPIPDSAVHVTREYAERTEENWNEPFWNMHIQDIKDCEYKLYSSDKKTTYIVIKNKQLTFRGEEYGPQCYKINGEDEYEFFYSLDENNTHRFLAQLRIATKPDISLERLLKTYFGVSAGSTRFTQFCDAVNVIYKYFSY